MPKKQSNSQGNKKAPKRRKINESKKIRENADKVRPKTVKVTLPAIIPGKGPYTPHEKTEYEISYEDAMLCVQIEALASKGLTNDQIIECLPISRDTFYKRLKEEPYFSYCLNKHRKKAVLDVENAVYQNAVGFQYMEQTATPSGKVVTVMKQKLPETKAAEFFLTNRDPDNWKKKVETTMQIGESMSGLTFVIKRREE